MPSTGQRNHPHLANFLVNFGFINPSDAAPRLHGRVPSHEDAATEAWMAYTPLRGTIIVPLAVDFSR
jgi:hypothetical protein